MAIACYGSLQLTTHKIQQPPVADMEPTQQAMSTQQAREEPPTEGMQRSMNEIPGPTSNIKLQYLSVPTFHPDQQEKSQGNCSCGSVVTHGDKVNQLSVIRAFSAAY